MHTNQFCYTLWQNGVGRDCKVRTVKRTVNNNVCKIRQWGYLDEMTKSYVSLDYKFGNQDYGYLWWLPYRNNDVIAAIGDGGNVIYINKKNNLSTFVIKDVE